MSECLDVKKPLAPGKFQDPHVTAKGEPRAQVALSRLETLWFNTGTLCNITCANCYIASSPRNDDLVYLSVEDAAPFLDEAEALGRRPREIGFTGGEPFLNPAMPDLLSLALGRGYDVLVLTNAMQPMMRPRVRDALMALGQDEKRRLTVRVSLDHYSAARHDAERGEGAFAHSLAGLRWLSAGGFRIAVAGRLGFAENEDDMREGFARLFESEGLAIAARDRAALVLFPEMDETAEVPEITTACWGILNKSPDSVMCASSRMVVRRKGAGAPAVLACTLLAYDPRFELGGHLGEALGPVSLNHPHCAKFCVLGGASCSAR